MTMFQRSFYVEDPLTNIFRVFEDIEKHNRQAQNARGRRHAFHFNPRFDVRETETAYELHGELPGVDSKDIEIEFTEPQTMIVRGRTERNYNADAPVTAEAPVEAPVEDTHVDGAATPASDISAGWHQASVADEETEATNEKAEAPAVAAADPVETPKKEEALKPKDRYHHRERAIGQFRRSFAFPSRVDETAVSAKLNNGLLHVTIPKAPKHEVVRVAVN